MRGRSAVGVAGIAVGIGLALAGPAAADAGGATNAANAIDDAWPYGGLDAYGVPPAIPGFVEAGSVTDSGRDQFGPITNSYADYIATRTKGGTDEGYSAHSNTFVVPNLYEDDHEAVKHHAAGRALPRRPPGCLSLARRVLRSGPLDLY